MSDIAKWKSKVSDWYSDITNNQTHSTEKLANHVGSRFYHGSFFLLWTPQTTHRPTLLECQVLDNVTVQALHVFICW